MRRKLWVLMVLLFASGIVTLKIFPNNDTREVIASQSGAAAQETEYGVLSGENVKFAAHRGYSNYAPENSIPAFELAGKMGFWGIETDISQTSDGYFVCMHDEDIDRTTDGSGAVSDYTLEELSGFKIDSGNYVSTTENLKIPTFEEYLEICTRYGCAAVVEIKTISDYDAFLNIIIESGLENNCVITCNNIDDLKEIRARNSVIPVMTIGYDPAPYTDNLAYISEIPENRGVLYQYTQIEDKSVVDMLHQQGLYCGVWSVDDSDTAWQYLDYGVDFIVTNEIPARLEQMINENE